MAALPPDAITVLDEIAAAGEQPSSVLASRCSMSNDRIGAAVSALVQAGLISVFRGPAGQPLVRLTAHASVRGLLRHPVAATASQGTKQLLEARASLEEMQEVLREFPVGVERMLTPEQLAETMQEIALGTRKEVISVLAGPAPTPEMLADSQDRDVELVQRLVKVRLLYPVEHAGLEHVARYAEELAEAGAEVRFADRLPHRLLVFDQRVAVAPLDYSDSGHGAMVVREPILARSLGHLAATMFRRGRRLEEALAGDDKPSGPSPVDRRVLMLMGSGLADAACASRLGVTDRTFRRYVGSLLNRLGASSRFDAGVKAVEQGWI
ncbi:MAG: hypothetical protein H0V10_05090 [Geodermatophilaceae bacterium]|nr:hypothetical protein [Geodermatophilaceae bacterium]